MLWSSLFYYSVIFITDLSVIYAGRGFSDVLEESNSVFLSKGKKCGSAGEIFYGRFEYTGVSFGDLATAVCQEGWDTAVDMIQEYSLFCF